MIISIIALILAIVAFDRTVGQADRGAQIKDLQRRMEKMKEETSDRVNKGREGMTKTFDKIGKVVKKEESKQ